MAISTLLGADLDPEKVVATDILSEDVRQNWPSYLHEWAGRSPFYSVSQGVPYLVVASYADCFDVFRGDQAGRFRTTWDAGSEAFGDVAPGRRPGVALLFGGLPIIGNLGGSAHKRVRSAMQPSFGVHGIGVHADYIDATVERLLDDIEAGGGEFDAMADFGRRVIRDVLLKGMLGLGPEYVDPLITLAEQLPKVVAAGERTPEYRRAFDGVVAIADEMLEHGRDHRSDDFVGRMVGACHDETISRDEFVGGIMAIGVGGLTATAGSTGMMLYRKCRHPEQFEMVRRDPDLVPSAVEECLRMHPSSLIVQPRFASEETEIGGTIAYPGMPIIPCIPLANHDPAQFENPYELDVRRPPKHLTFGKGIHSCLGTVVARRIMSTSLSRFLERFPDFRLVDPEFTPTYQGLVGELQPRELPMQIA